MIRVLQVYPQLNNAGTEMVIMNFYRNIDRKIIQFDFLVQKKGELDENVKKLGARIFYIENGQDYAEKIKEFLNEHKEEFKIIHTHIHREMGIVLKIAAKVGIPYRIAHSHNARTDLPKVMKFYKMITGYNIERYATHFVACSDEAAEWLFPRKYGQAVVWKNAIEMERFVYSDEVRNEKRKELDIPLSGKVVCHVGRFAKEKNHKRILMILNDLMKKDKENKESILSDLPLWGLLFLVCVLLQVYVRKDRPLIQPPRQGSIVKTDQKQVYLPELIQSLFDKEKTK